MEDPTIWQDQKRAQEIGKKAARIQAKIDAWEKLKTELDDNHEMAVLAQEEGELELLADLTAAAKDLEERVTELELTTLLSGPYDAHDAIVALHAGAGGTEAMDWVEMLYRMYTRWTERRGFQAEVLDILPGEEAGLKSVTVSVKGDYAYGFLRSEKGVHRLVRISPFDSNARRHTSFASVDVLPEIAEDDEIQIDPDEIRVDTFRSSGAGGQNVQKVDSAVRVIHLPTGVVVSCQNERSQYSNKVVAMRLLSAKLLVLREEERRKEIETLRGPQKEIAWGSQIRSYVFQPYTLVKDHRTGTEVGSVDRVMDGDIDEFIYAKLQQEAGGAQPAAEDR
jgi:peptide chain release factor 2